MKRMWIKSFQEKSIILILEKRLDQVLKIFKNNKKVKSKLIL